MPSHDVRTLQGRLHAEASLAPFAVLPVGSVEYHGPHGPFGTDLTLSEGFAERVANRTGALLFPAVAYTFVPRLTREHGAAVSVAPDVFLAYLCEVLRGVTAFGPKRVMIVNGHSENQYALRLAAETVTEEMPEASILLVNWWQWTPEGACRADGEGGADPWGENHGNGHGGPLELSVTAAFDADGVSVPASDADVAYEAPWWRGRAQVVGLGQSPHGFAGYHGLVSAIDVGRGRRVVEGVTETLTTLANGWLARVHPDG